MISLNERRPTFALMMVNISGAAARSVARAVDLERKEEHKVLVLAMFKIIRKPQLEDRLNCNFQHEPK
jgi:hypothetical protein